MSPALPGFGVCFRLRGRIGHAELSSHPAGEDLLSIFSLSVVESELDSA
jgi:hypothetical protein